MEVVKAHCDCRLYHASGSQFSIGINSTASYFGDSRLLPEDIEGIVEAVFKKGEIKTTHEGKHTNRFFQYVINICTTYTTIRRYFLTFSFFYR